MNSVKNAAADRWPVDEFRPFMGKPKRKYTITEMCRAIEAVGASPSKIARELHCSTGTVYTYARKYPEVKAAFEKAKGQPVEENPKYPKALFIEAIEKSHGVKASVAALLKCSRQTVDNYLERDSELAEAFDAARSTLVGKAANALVNEIENPASDGHTRAYMFVLKTLGKDEGFVERSEVTGADGAALLEIAPEIAQQVSELGLNVNEVLRNLVLMRQAEVG